MPKITKLSNKSKNKLVNTAKVVINERKKAKRRRRRQTRATRQQQKQDQPLIVVNSGGGGFDRGLSQQISALQSEIAKQNSLAPTLPPPEAPTISAPALAPALVPAPVIRAVAPTRPPRIFFPQSEVEQPPSETQYSPMAIWSSLSSSPLRSSGVPSVNSLSSLASSPLQSETEYSPMATWSSLSSSQLRSSGIPSVNSLSSLASSPLQTPDGENSVSYESVPFWENPEPPKPRKAPQPTNVFSLPDWFVSRFYHEPKEQDIATYFQAPSRATSEIEPQNSLPETEQPALKPSPVLTNPKPSTPPSLSPEERDQSMETERQYILDTILFTNYKVGKKVISEDKIRKTKDRNLIREVYENTMVNVGGGEWARSPQKDLQGNIMYDDSGAVIAKSSKPKTTKKKKRRETLFMSGEEVAKAKAEGKTPLEKLLG